VPRWPTQSLWQVSRWVEGTHPMPHGAMLRNNTRVASSLSNDKGWQRTTVASSVMPFPHPELGDLRACSAHTRAHAHTHTQHHSPHAILTPPHLHQQAMSHMHAHDNNWRVLTSAHPAGAPPCLLSAWEGDYCSPVVHDHVWLRACAGVCARRFAPSPRAPINAHSPRAPHVVNQ
jgi:hypothetical protein